MANELLTGGKAYEVTELVNPIMKREGYVSEDAGMMRPVSVVADNGKTMVFHAARFTRIGGAQPTPM